MEGIAFRARILLAIRLLGEAFVEAARRWVRFHPLRRGTKNRTLRLYLATAGQIGDDL
jgi:hypothetical protein